MGALLLAILASLLWMRRVRGIALDSAFLHDAAKCIAHADLVLQCAQSLMTPQNMGAMEKGLPALGLLAAELCT